MAARHVLLVEDDQDLSLVLTQVLENAGYRVSTAHRRRDARAILQQGDVDLIVTDSVLRGGNGDDIVRAGGSQGIPIIMMSGEPERIARYAAGSLPFLQKPFRAGDLLKMVNDLLP